MTSPTAYPYDNHGGRGSSGHTHTQSEIIGLETELLDLSQKGATTDRPDPAHVGPGVYFFDETLGLPIWSNGTIWINALGAPV